MHLFHKWVTVKESMSYRFQECSKCKKRRAVKFSSFPDLSQKRWLNGGEFWSLEELAIMMPNHPAIKDFMFSKEDKELETNQESI